MDVFSTVFYGAPVALLLACALILWLVWANRRLRAVIGEVEAQSSTQYEAGKIHGWAECEAKWRNEPLYKQGYTAGERAGYQRANVELLGVVAEMDVTRQSGELVKS